MNTRLRRHRDLIGGAPMAVVLAAGAFTFWYRATYNVLPGQGASTCGPPGSVPQLRPGGGL